MTPNEWRVASAEKKTQRRVTWALLIVSTAVWAWLLITILNGGAK